MNFEWKIIFIGAEEKVWKNWIPKITFVVEEEGKEYPSSIAIDVWKDKIDEIKKFVVGDIVKLSLNSKAREYNGKYFNSISAWRFQKIENWLDNSWDDSWLPF